MKDNRDDLTKTLSDVLTRERVFLTYLSSMRRLAVSELETATARYEQAFQQRAYISPELGLELHYYQARLNVLDSIKFLAKENLTVDWDDVEAELIKVHSTPNENTFRFQKCNEYESDE